MSEKIALPVEFEVQGPFVDLDNIHRPHPTPIDIIQTKTCLHSQCGRKAQKGFLCLEHDHKVLDLPGAKERHQQWLKTRDLVQEVIDNIILTEQRAIRNVEVDVVRLDHKDPLKVFCTIKNYYLHKNLPVEEVRKACAEVGVF